MKFDAHLKVISVLYLGCNREMGETQRKQSEKPEAVTSATGLQRCFIL